MVGQLQLVSWATRSLIFRCLRTTVREVESRTAGIHSGQMKTMSHRDQRISSINNSTINNISNMVHLELLNLSPVMECLSILSRAVMVSLLVASVFRSRASGSRIQASVLHRVSALLVAASVLQVVHSGRLNNSSRCSSERSLSLSNKRQTPCLINSIHSNHMSITTRSHRIIIIQFIIRLLVPSLRALF